MSAKQRPYEAANAKPEDDKTASEQTQSEQTQAGAAKASGEPLDAEKVSEEVKAAFSQAAEEGEDLAEFDAALDPEAARIAELETETAALRDRLQRAAAEMENLRRRSERERQDVAKYAAANLARDLVGVTDNLRRALDSVPAEEAEANESLKNLLAGVEMTERDMKSVLERHHVVEIAALGEPFDPHHHEALFEVPTEEHPSGTVVQVIQTGYKLHDRLLRPARVGVAKSSAAPNAKPGDRVDTRA